MIKHTIKALVLLQLAVLPAFALAQSPQVIINEIAWMGTSTSAADEWIELLNPTSQEVSLQGWFLEAQDGSPKIELLGGIKPFSFYLLERTDDNALLGIKADLIYKGALSNQGEYLALVDSRGVAVDIADALSGWPSGDNTTKQTMERKLEGGWQTSLNPGGTPKAENSPGVSPKDQKSQNERGNKPAQEVLEKEKPAAFLLGQKNDQEKIKEIKEIEGIKERSTLPRFILVFAFALAISSVFVFLIFRLKKAITKDLI